MFDAHHQNHYHQILGQLLRVFKPTSSRIGILPSKPSTFFLGRQKPLLLTGMVICSA